MTLKELCKFIKTEHTRLMKFYNVKEKPKLKYPITVKVMEEVGELADAVLSQDAIQRKEKLALKKSKEDIGDELADVLITTLILAENQNIDIEKYLNQAITKRKIRNY